MFGKFDLNASCGPTITAVTTDTDNAHKNACVDYETHHLTHAFRRSHDDYLRNVDIFVLDEGVSDEDA